jgi:hypothetical protein
VCLCGFHFLFFLALFCVIGSLRTGLIAYYPLDGNANDGGAVYAGFRFINGIANSNSYQFFICHSTNYDGFTAPVTLPSDQWVHVTIVKENNYHRIYKNGLIITEGTQLGQVIHPNDNLPLLIGAANFGQTNPATSITRYWSGKIDDLFLFNCS